MRIWKETDEVLHKFHLEYIKSQSIDNIYLLNIQLGLLLALLMTGVLM